MQLSTGRILQEVRRNRRMTLATLASELDVSAAFLSAIETEKKAMPADMVEKLTKILKMTSREEQDLRDSADRIWDRSAIKHLPPIERSAVAGFARMLPRLEEEERKEAIDQIERLMADLLKKTKG